jgi:hypothetical protein
MTTIHGESFSFYQIGFRCCSDAPNAPSGTTKPAPATKPSGKSLPSTNPPPAGAVIGS